jgi:hypothetical protein
VFYLAGADPCRDDQLGGLRLTKEGLRERDRVVIDAVRRGGSAARHRARRRYARRVDDTVAIHAATSSKLRGICGRCASARRSIALM